MRIEDVDESRLISAVGLELTWDEAIEFRGALDALLENPVGRHEHVSSADYLTEVTVWLEGAVAR